jgi:hypothetical protein
MSTLSSTTLENLNLTQVPAKMQQNNATTSPAENLVDPQTQKNTSNLMPTSSSVTRDDPILTQVPATTQQNNATTSPAENLVDQVPVRLVEAQNGLASSPASSESSTKSQWVDDMVQENLQDLKRMNLRSHNKAPDSTSARSIYYPQQRKFSSKPISQKGKVADKDKGLDKLTMQNFLFIHDIEETDRMDTDGEKVATKIDEDEDVIFLSEKKGEFIQRIQEASKEYNNILEPNDILTLARIGFIHLTSTRFKKTDDE